MPRLRLTAAPGVAALLAAGGGWWLIERSGAVYTSDARVRANMVAISSDVAGRILDIPVVAGDRIRPGDILVRLDDREASLALASSSLELKAVEAEIEREKLRASLAKSRGSNRVGAATAEAAAARADAASAAVLLQTAEAEHGRIRILKERGLATQAALDEAGARVEAARQAASRAAAAVAQGAAGIGEAEADRGEGQVIERSIEALSLKAHALRQQVALQKVVVGQHAIASPIDGLVDEVFADEGEYVIPGARIALAHDEGDVWIEANIKETEIARVEVGAPVEIRLDAAPDQACKGRVDRIRSAAAAEFALIPNANPTGVFTKITQRVPVRVTVEGACEQLRPGAMANLRISAGDPAASHAAR